MPTRKPSTREGKNLKRKVESKDVKLRRNKIVEKSKTPRTKVVKKTIQKAGNPVKTVKKTVTKKRVSKDISGRGAKVGAAVGAAVGGAALSAVTKNSPPSYRVKGNRSAGGFTAKETTPTNMKTTTKTVNGKKQTNYELKGNRTYKGKGFGGAGVAFSGLGAGAGAAIGNKLQKKNRKTVNKKVRTRTVNGVNKTAQRQKAKAQTKTMRAKKRGSKR